MSQLVYRFTAVDNASAPLERLGIKLAALAGSERDLGDEDDVIVKTIKFRMLADDNLERT